MEENFRASMMPAYEEFIKILSSSFAENRRTLSRFGENVSDDDL
jgi:hypothetical protein